MSDEETEKQWKAPGCLTTTFLIGVAAITGGTYLMSHWASLPGGGKAGTVVLVVVGTLFVLPMLLMLTLKVVLKTVLGRVSSEIAKAGEQMVDGMQQMYERVHEFRQADDDDFEDLDRDFYDSTRRDLQAHGFRHVGDLVDATIEEINGTVAVIRVMVSPDATTQVGFYQLPMSMVHLPDRKLFTYDVTSEFTDGEFLISSNTAESDLLDSPPALHAHKYSLDTPLDRLLELHEAQRRSLLAGKPDARCVTFSTIEDVIESEKHQQIIKNNFRQGIGYLGSREVRRIAGTVKDENLDPAMDIGDIAARAVEDAREKMREG